MEIEGKTYYEILGVTRDASPDEIKEAYREIARVFHPDSNFYDEIFENTPGCTPEDFNAAIADKFKLITAAYNTLINSDKRHAYNAKLAPELRAWTDEFHISDKAIIESEGEVLKQIKKPKDEVPQSRARAAWGCFGVLREGVKEEAPPPPPLEPIEAPAPTSTKFYRNVALLSLFLGIAVAVTFRLWLSATYVAN